MAFERYTRWAEISRASVPNLFHSTITIGPAFPKILNSSFWSSQLSACNFSRQFTRLNLCIMNTCRRLHVRVSVHLISPYHHTDTSTPRPIRTNVTIIRNEANLLSMYNNTARQNYETQCDRQNSKIKNGRRTNDRATLYMAGSTSAWTLYAANSIRKKIEITLSGRVCTWIEDQVHTRVEPSGCALSGITQ